MAVQSVDGTITPTGDVVDILIEADNPGGTITPFGSLVFDAAFEMAPPGLDGVITPIGELSLTSDRDCFNTPYTCVEVPTTEFECVAACTDQSVSEPPAIELAGLIIPIGRITELDCPECDECPECPPPCPPNCPSEAVDAALIQTGVHSGDLAFTMLGSEPAPAIGSWVGWSDDVGSFQAQYRELGDFGQGGAGSGNAMNGLGYIRLQFAGSFTTPGISMHMKRKYTGYVAGQNVGVIFKWIHLSVFNVVTRGQSEFTVVADGSGNIVAQFDFVEAFTGILLGEFYWIESLTLLNPENPQCPE